MIKKFETSILILIKFLVFCVSALTFFIPFGIIHPFMLKPSRTMFVVLGVFLIVYIMMNVIYGGFDIGRRKSKPIIYSFILNFFFTDIAAHFFMCIMNFTLINNGKFVYEYPLLLLLIFILQCILITFITYLTHYVYFKFNKPQRCILIARDGEETDNIISKIKRYKKQYDLTEIVSLNQPNILNKIDSADTIFFYNLSVSERNALIEYCYHYRKNIYYSVELSDIVSQAGNRVYFEDKSMVFAPVRGLTFEQRIIKRCMDLAISGFGLLITSPILLITAILIKLEDGGPVFYTQERATYGGRIFKVIKFRSMKVKAGSVHRSVTANDDRITKIGKFIRKFRIDELPQLINVIKSDMSIVGPRPEMIENVSQYTKDLPEFSYRNRAKAGLTGMAQIYGKYNTSPKDKLVFDLTYINQYNIWMDIKLIFRTLLVLLTPDVSTEAFDKSPKNTSKDNETPEQ